MTNILVLMAAYNPLPQQLFRTIDSLLASATPCDILLIDDGSSLPISSLIDSKYPEKRNIICVRIHPNQGLTKALNVGLKEPLCARYEYIARMDVGDISHAHRLALQRNFLEEHSEISGVGCWYSFFDEETSLETKYIHTPLSPNKFKKKLYYNSATAHSSWFVRRLVYENLNGYNEEFSVAQDYEFLCRATKKGYKFDNVPQVLLSCSENDNGISSRKRGKQLRARLKIQVRNISIVNIHSVFGVLRTLLTMSTPPYLMSLVKKILYKK